MHIQTVIKPRLQESVKTGGCNNCHVSCQSACKTSITVSNHPCEQQEKK